MNKRTVEERIQLLTYISGADFERGKQVWEEYLNHHPNSTSYSISGRLRKEAERKFEEQSKEYRDRLRSHRIPNSDLRHIRDYKDETELPEYVRKLQEIDVTVGRKIIRNTWSNDRYTFKFYFFKIYKNINERYFI